MATFAEMLNPLHFFTSRGTSFIVHEARMVNLFRNAAIAATVMTLAVPSIILVHHPAVAQYQLIDQQLRACRNFVSNKYINIPLADITVSVRRVDASNGAYINWTIRSTGATGYCYETAEVRTTQFVVERGPAPPTTPTATERQLQACRNFTANKYQYVPIADISVSPRRVEPSGNAYINWRIRNGASGYCYETYDARTTEFVVEDPGPNQPPPDDGRYRTFANVSGYGTVTIDRASYYDSNALRQFTVLLPANNRQQWTANCRTRETFDHRGQFVPSPGGPDISAFVCTDGNTPPPRPPVGFSPQDLVGMERVAAIRMAEANGYRVTFSDRIVVYMQNGVQQLKLAIQPASNRVLSVSVMQIPPR